MAELPFEDPPPQWRIMVTLLACVLLAGFLQIIGERASDNFIMRALGSDALSVSIIKLVIAVLLCAFTFRASGLTAGEKIGWKKHWLAVVFVWVLPLLMVAILAPALGKQAAAAKTIDFCLLSPLAEGLLFSALIYGQMQVIFGKPPQALGGALGAAPLITAFLFALYFWPALRTSDESGGASPALYQMVYAFGYSTWVLNMRRWTACAWPCILNHIAINTLLALR